MASLLGVSLAELIELSNALDNYLEWQTSPKPSAVLAGLEHKPRHIQQPKSRLLRTQRRLADLLQRIERPDYLYSASKGRSYAMNALRHQAAEPTLKVDIKSFYERVPPKTVHAFYKSALLCSSDVARVLTNLSIIRNHIPTGSPVSPVLSFFAYEQMFSAVARLANNSGGQFTLYVDDMAITGPGVTRASAGAILSELRRNELHGHKLSYFPAGQAKVITGVALVNGTIDIPYKRQRRIRKLRQAFDACTVYSDALTLGNALVGQYREASKITPGIERHADDVLHRLGRMRENL